MYARPRQDYETRVFAICMCVRSSASHEQYSKPYSVAACIVQYNQTKLKVYCDTLEHGMVRAHSIARERANTRSAVQMFTLRSQTRPPALKHAYAHTRAHIVPVVQPTENAGPNLISSRTHTHTDVILNARAMRACVRLRAGVYLAGLI